MQSSAFLVVSQVNIRQLRCGCLRGVPCQDVVLWQSSNHVKDQRLRHAGRAA